MNRIKTMVLIMVIISFIGCNHAFSIKGSGNIIKENRKIDNTFSGIKISNHGDLFVQIGENVKLVIEGDDNIVPHIISKVSGKLLTISSDRKLRRGFRSRKGVRYFLTVKKGQLNSLKTTSHGDIKVPELTGKKIKISLTSHGDVEVERIDAEEVELYLTSHGDIEIGNIKADLLGSKQTSHSKVKIRSGNVKNQNLYLSSHGDFLAKNVESLNCEVKITSHGKVVVFCKEVLKAKITGHGDLYYRGKPDLKAKKGSNGTIRSMD